MKKMIFASSVALLTFLGLGLLNLASAHEHDVFQIGDKQYTFTVGSLNEPVVVDDKTSVDLTVVEGSGMPTMGPDGDMDGPAAKTTPVTGLDKALQVEISAGGQKKTFNLTPAYGKDGAYYATFYPTVQTTYAYRFFGTLNNTPIDLTFTCNPAPSSVQAADNTKVDLSGGVSRVSKAGSFGCPLAKADLGFPVAGMTNADLSSKIDSQKSSNNSKTLATSALALSVLGIAFGGYAARKK